MPKDFLAGVRPHYDVTVIGSGLGGLTAANVLAREGRTGLASRCFAAVPVRAELDLGGWAEEDVFAH